MRWCSCDWLIIAYIYLRETRQKRADGSTLTHLQLAESVWDPIKRQSKIRVVFNCGRADDPAVAERLRRLARSILRRCAPEEIVAEQPDWRLVEAWPYGDVYVLEQLWQRLGIAGTETLELHHLYRAMDFLEVNKEAIEQAIYFRVADLLNADVEPIFYDTTSLHFEIDEADAGAGEANTVRGSLPAGAKRYPAPRQRGHSKNGRSDAPQIVVGLAVTREGLPVHRGGEVDRQVVSRPGRYRPVAENLQVKEVTVGNGERRQRYVMCYNPQEAERQRRHRGEVLCELEAEIESLRDPCTPGHSKRVCALRASRRYGRYLRLSKAGQPVIDATRVKAAERLDGKFVVHSNDDTLSAEDVALGYKQLQCVEEAWRRLKSGLRMRPVYHWAVHRIHAQVALTVLALRLERAAELACADTWRNIRADLTPRHAVQLHHR
ncbi:IS1634 family transposase [Nitrococcus mobilis]|uniref:Transposase n=1 Tax=Nitrococcus mobilis Nb-231 TaxID=314278 RepID=A4BLR4_9GAMM|nr:hypothetical protein [Nitrococcus mobilis]EAR23252.1 transposase [Nitrococcus mobilis Nb-231]